MIPGRTNIEMRYALMKITFMVSIMLLLGITNSSYADTAKWENEPDNFRGITFGSTEDDVKNIIPGIDCKDTKSGRSCYDPYYKIGETITGCLLTLNEGKLSSVNIVFKSDDYDNIKFTFIEKYGKPMKSVNYDIKTRAGVKQKNNKLLWYGDKLIVSLQKYCDDLHNGCSYYMQKSALNRFSKEPEKEKKKK
jgi:hypothetical protein